MARNEWPVSNGDILLNSEGMRDVWVVQEDEVRLIKEGAIQHSVSVEEYETFVGFRKIGEWKAYKTDKPETSSRSYGDEMLRIFCDARFKTLHHFAQNRGKDFSGGDVARAIDCSRAHTYNIIRVLEEEGYLRKTRTVSGAQLYELGDSPLARAVQACVDAFYKKLAELKQ